MLNAGRCSQHNNKQDLGVNLGEADGWARAAAESGHPAARHLNLGVAR